MESLVSSPNTFVAFTFYICHIGPVALAIAFVVFVRVALDREFRVVVMMMMVVVMVVVMMISVMLHCFAFRELAEGLAKATGFRWAWKSTITTVAMA